MDYLWLNKDEVDDSLKCMQQSTFTDVLKHFWLLLQQSFQVTSTFKWPQMLCNTATYWSAMLLQRPQRFSQTLITTALSWANVWNRPITGYNRRPEPPPEPGDAACFQKSVFMSKQWEVWGQAVPGGRCSLRLQMCQMCLQCIVISINSEFGEVAGRPSSILLTTSFDCIFFCGNHSTYILLMAAIWFNRILIYPRWWICSWKEPVKQMKCLYFTIKAYLKS